MANSFDGVPEALRYPDSTNTGTGLLQGGSIPAADLADATANRKVLEVDLVDVGGGNIGSVRRCLDRLGVRFQDVGAENLPRGKRPLILPGVGAFGTVMQSLRRRQLDVVLRELVSNGTPLLGICVGMQVLFDRSEECNDVAGLSLIPGEVVRFTEHKVPQIGWNTIQPIQPALEGGFAYFVNSFYCRPACDEVVLYTADYGVRFCAALKSGSITAFQFHPEKSGAFGARLLARWINSVG